MKEKFRYEIPEGGWGILICIGASIPFASGIACLPSFGLVFGDFLLSIGAETSAMSFITSSYFLSLSTAGLFSGSLFKRFGLRRTALYGGIIFTLGSFLQIFVRSTFDLLVAFSLLQGIGFGIMLTTFYSIFNDYFVKTRFVWMGFAQSLIGILVMLYPVMVQALLENYGFRGTLAILCAINANAICGMQVFHPVKWHMRKVPIKDHELAQINDHTLDANENDSKQEELDTDPLNQNSPLMTKAEKSINAEKGKHELGRRSSSITSIGHLTGAAIVNDDSPCMTRHHSVLVNTKIPHKNIWQMIVDFLDLSLLKNPIYVNIAFGISCALYSDIAFFTLLSMYLFDLGFTKHATSRILAIGAAADLISRIVLTFTAIFVKTSSRNIYLAGAFFTIICRCAFVEVHDFMGVACITAALGFLRTWLHVPLPLVLAEYLPKERFPTGYGLYLFMQGLITFAVGPIVGYMRDVTKSYVITFHVLNVIMCVCVFPWILEYAYLKFIKKQKLNMPMPSNIRTDKIVH